MTKSVVRGVIMKYSCVVIKRHSEIWGMTGAGLFPPKTLFYYYKKLNLHITQPYFHLKEKANFYKPQILLFLQLNSTY